MATTAGTSQLFDWLTEERLMAVAAKLRQLPTGEQFRDRVEAAISRTVDIEERTYEEIVEDHGDVIGYTDQGQEQLPWWLEDFEWTVTADPLGPLEISENTLEQFEDYPLDSTRVDQISLTSGESIIEGLDAFSRLEEALTTAVESPADSAPDDKLSHYELPEKLFVVPDRGRIDTSDAFQTWLEHLVNLCPPGCPELTALLRVNTNVQRQHATQVLEQEEIDLLTELGLLKDNEATSRIFNENFYDPLTTLLKITLPFDLELEVGNDSNDLTDLQYAYYRGWSQDTDRLPNEQQWLRKAQNQENLSDSEEYRFAEFAFRLPIRLASSTVTFEDQGRIASKSEPIGDILEKYGHPINDD